MSRMVYHRVSLLDVVAAYGSEAVVARIAALRAGGRRHAAKAIERELDQLDLLDSRFGPYRTSAPVFDRVVSRSRRSVHPEGGSK